LLESPLIFGKNTKEIDIRSVLHLLSEHRSGRLKVDIKNLYETFAVADYFSTIITCPENSKILIETLNRIRSS
jgi:hypothetical protein